MTKSVNESQVACMAIGEGKEHLTTYLNSKAEYVDKVKNEVSKAYSA